MKNTKFVVKVNRGGTLKPEYVQRIDRIPIQMTSDRKLALLMGRLTAEDAVKSIQTLRCSPELVSVVQDETRRGLDPTRRVVMRRVSVPMSAFAKAV